MAEKKRQRRRGQEAKAPAVKPPNSRQTTIQFDYIKGNFFRVIHVDGIFGGPSPNGRDIHMAVWNQRSAYPQHVVQELKPDNKIGAELSREGKQSIVRELEAALVFDTQMARSLIKWLERKIAQIEAGGDEPEEIENDEEHTN